MRPRPGRFEILSRQIKTFKIRKKDAFIIEGNSSNNIIINNKKNTSGNDSPYSIHSINSSNVISNVLSSINVTNCHSKNSSNISSKEKNINLSNINRICDYSSDNNKTDIIYEEKENQSTIPINNINSNNKNNIKKKNSKIISKRIVKKKLISNQINVNDKIPKDNTKLQKNENIKEINTKTLFEANKPKF